MPSLYGDKKQAFIKIPIYQPSTLECQFFFSHSSLVGLSLVAGPGLQKNAL